MFTYMYMYMYSTCTVQQYMSGVYVFMCPQPIPPHTMDLTLVSTSKFVGCCYLATSQDYVIVVTKGEADSQTTPTGTGRLL